MALSVCLLGTIVIGGTGGWIGSSTIRAKSVPCEKVETETNKRNKGSNSIFFIANSRFLNMTIA